MSDQPVPDPAQPALAATANGIPPPPAADDEGASAPMSLGARLRQPRTILSFVVPIVLLVLIFRVFLNVDFERLVASIANANKLLLLAAFGVYYLGFPVRGYRWSRILRGTGVRVKTKDATEILFLSWLVNCLVPAKLGDLYRAYLLKINVPASLSKTFGTVFIERFLDLFVIAILGLAAGFWSFRSGFPPEIQAVVGFGIGVVIILAVALVSLRNFGRPLLERLPVPARFLEFYDRFEEGVFGAVTARQLPPLIGLTVLIWLTEGMRLYLVIQALGFPDVSMGISGALFVALIGSLLTAVPLSPAGLGIVQLGTVGVMVGAYGIPVTEATTIALVDTAISVFSIILFGSIVYVFSDKRNGTSSMAADAAADGAADGAAAGAV